MSPFGSNFHHDSFEWIGPPKKPWNPPTSLNYRSNTSINIDFSGVGKGMKTAAKWGFWGNVVGGLSNIASAWILSKGNEKGATILGAGMSIAGSIFGGGYGFGGGYYGGGYGGYGVGYGGQLSDPPHTYIGPYARSIHPGLDGYTGVGNNGQVQQGNGNDSKAKDKEETTPENTKGETSDTRGTSTVTDDQIKEKAETLNAAIDDTLDADGNGKNDVFYGHAQNTKYTYLQDTISQSGDKNGIKKGISSSGKYKTNENENTKTQEGFYKYITVTDRDSKNEWTYEFTRIDGNGDPVYTLKPDLSNFSKDDTNTSKGYEKTGQQPEYTVTVDKTNGKIDLKSSSNLFGATTKGSSGIISN